MIHLIPALSDNYCYVVEGDDKRCVIVDPGEAAPVEDFITHRGLHPAAILNTHHHGDHVGGNATLKKRFECEIVGPAAEATKIPSMDRGAVDGDRITFAGLEFQVIATPGHTAGHVVFYLPEQTALFSGDTLFSLGCGRLFEGIPADMFESLAKLKLLPPETMIYCGHEYTAANLAFALHEYPDDPALLEKVEAVSRLRSTLAPTVPVSLGDELAANPFLRAETLKQFAGLRARKDDF